MPWQEMFTVTKFAGLFGFPMFLIAGIEDESCVLSSRSEAGLARGKDWVFLRLNRQATTRQPGSRLSRRPGCLYTETGFSTFS